MAKRKVTKLFAVVALAASAPALAETPKRPVEVAAPAKPDPWAVASAPDPVAVPVQQQVALLADSLRKLFGISAPRTLDTGAPACGNVASRAPRPCK